MNVDVLVAEIGSTTTIINAFNGIGGKVHFLGQGQAPTSVQAGDVRTGLQAAKKALCDVLGTEKIVHGEMFATSSAAGGLRMSVHGLVHDMTVRAAEAAALGAGGVIKMVTAGKLTEFDLDEIRRLHPNLILIAGGTDYGERETARSNTQKIASLGMTDVPVIYAGNIQNHAAVRSVMEGARQPFTITENVYSKLDMLNIEPARRAIQEVFERHIVNAPGMSHIREVVDGPIMPTPGAVMEAAILLYGEIGDLMVIDIGGATTDVHSVTQGSDEIGVIQTRPEPFAKRTVEGDLGLYINAENLIQRLGAENLSRELGIDVGRIMIQYKPIPETPDQFRLTERLCLEAGLVAVSRHAGSFRHLYLPEGRKTIAEGKDLTLVRHILATGGALTRLPGRRKLLRRMADCNINRQMLYPAPGKMKLLFDTQYVMSCLGVLSRRYPEAALQLLKSSLQEESAV